MRERVTMTGMPSPPAWSSPRPRWLAGAWLSLWAGLLLAPSVSGLGRAARPALSGAGLLLLAATFGVTMWPALVRPRREHPWPAQVAAALLAVLAALVVGIAADVGIGALPALVAIAVGGVASVRWAPGLVLAVALGAVALGAATSAGTDALWTVGMTTLLAGLLTVAFAWLGEVIGELQATREELARAAVAEERVRFARDLHDLLGHTLSVIVVKAQVARRAASTDPAAAAAHSADIERIGREALGEVRQAVQGYRSPTLDAELARAGATLRAVGIDVEVRTAHAGLSPEEDEMLGWVVREGVTNVIRHARARHAVIATSTDGTGSRVVIEDDGVGPGPGPSDGSGLAGLRERAQSAGGRLEVSADAAGFRLAAVIPAQDWA